MRLKELLMTVSQISLTDIIHSGEKDSYILKSMKNVN